MNSQTCKSFDGRDSYLNRRTTVQKSMSSTLSCLTEMRTHLAAHMCKIDQTMPSMTVESEPENVLNTLSPGRNSRLILLAELETPNRPTSSGLQSPIGPPVQLGPIPLTREYSVPPLGHIPPAQWEMFMVEPEMMDVNYLVLHWMEKNQKNQYVHNQQSSSKMN